MYATCIGLILKGYNDYDQHHKEFKERFVKLEVPANLKKKVDAVPETPVAAPVNESPAEAPKKQVDMGPRIKFWDKFKNNLIELFKEEEDQVIR